MKLIVKVLGEIFDFFCGDWIIFWGIAITIVALELIKNFSILLSFKAIWGIFLVLGISLSFIVALKKEINIKK